MTYTVHVRSYFYLKQFGIPIISCSPLPPSPPPPPLSLQRPPTGRRTMCRRPPTLSSTLAAWQPQQLHWPRRAASPTASWLTTSSAPRPRWEWGEGLALTGHTPEGGLEGIYRICRSISRSSSTYFPSLKRGCDLYSEYTVERVISRWGPALTSFTTEPR